MNEPAPRTAPKPTPHYGRARHRAMNHESAHAESLEAMPVEKIIDHPLVPRGQGELIIDQDALSEFIDHLRAAGRFAYDSEFIGEMTYHPQLCLIQASTSQRIGLIDPMADMDLTPFWKLLADPAIEKIVHAGEQDVEPVHRLIQSPAANIFDTQIVAGFVGLAYPVGLSKLVYELLRVKLGKGLTFTHWDQRPLSPMQLKYAADDVRYLPALHQELSNRLESRGHSDWAREECAALTDPARYDFDPNNDFFRLRGAGSLSPQALAILRELMIWRDQSAMADDVPARAFLKDEILVDMARSTIKSIDKLARIKGLPRPVEQAHGNAIVEATARGLAVPPGQRPVSKNIEPTPSERFGAESLYTVAAALSAGHSIDPALVCSRQDVAELYRAVIVDRGPNPDIPLVKGWRAQACGDELLKLIQGKHQIKLTWNKGHLQAGSD